MINHYIPSSLHEALEILSSRGCYILAGGTDLMVQKHRSSGLLPTFEKDILYISNLEELNYVKEDEKGVHIGASTKYRDLENNELVPQMLRDVIREIASPNIRNMATIVGNIANASPAGDSLVALYLLDTIIVLESKDGRREVPIEKFIKGVRKHDRKPHELITEIIIPQDYKKFTGYMWRKVGSRAAESITKVSFLGAYKIQDKKVADLRISFGSVGTTIIRSEKLEEKYIGLNIRELHAQIPSILQKYAGIINPITDQRSTKDYRKKVALNLLEAFLKSIKL